MPITFDQTDRTFDETCWTWDGYDGCPRPRPSGSGGGGTGTKYYKAVRESIYRKGKVRIGKLEDVLLPNPREWSKDKLTKVVNEISDAIIEDVTEEAASESNLTLKAIADVMHEAAERLKKKKRLEELRRQIRAAFLKGASIRRQKKADARIRAIVKEEVEQALAEEVAKARVRAEEDDLIAIMYILAEIS